MATVSHLRLGLSGFSNEKKNYLIANLHLVWITGERSQLVTLVAVTTWRHVKFSAPSAPIVMRWETDRQMGQVLVWEETVPHIVRPPPGIGVKVTRGEVSCVDTRYKPHQSWMSQCLKYVCAYSHRSSLIVDGTTQQVKSRSHPPRPCRNRGWCDIDAYGFMLQAQSLGYSAGTGFVTSLMSARCT
jgi:hypothetical protein